jgi:hypothetical protein
MYFIPLIVILVLALAILFSPILAAILAVLFLIGLGAYKFFGPGVDPEHAPPPQTSTGPANAPDAAPGSSADENAGPWGETWPEQRQSEEPST